MQSFVVGSKSFQSHAWNCAALHQFIIYSLFRMRIRSGTERWWWLENECDWCYVCMCVCFTAVITFALLICWNASHKRDLPLDVIQLECLGGACCLCVSIDRRKTNEQSNRAVLCLSAILINGKGGRMYDEGMLIVQNRIDFSIEWE